MKTGENYFPKSSFLSIDKDLSLIINKLITNQNLLKLLYYTEKDCLSAPDLTYEQISEMIGKQIRIVPYLQMDNNDCPNYIVITMDKYTPNQWNPEFRDCTINFDIFCNPDHWNLGNFQLRPHKIAGEIDAMIDGQKLSGIGVTNFYAAGNLMVTNELMGLSLIYTAIHGNEDKIDPLTDGI